MRLIIVLIILIISSTVIAASNKIDGVCGSADGTAIAIKPTTNLCAIGSASAVIGMGPWSWTCKGIKGGNTVSCSAPVLPPNPILSLTVIPSNPIVDPVSPLGTIIARANASWSNGASFTGTINFVPPYANDNGIFSLNGSNIVTNANLSTLDNTTQFITLQAAQ